MVVLVAASAVRQAIERRGPDAVELPGQPLRAAFAPRAVGTAVDATALRDEPGYREVLGAQFSSLTPENAMKWSIVQPARGEFAWEDADRIVDFARDRDQEVRGHPLVWHGQLPDWLQGLAADELRQVMREHIRALVERYRGRVATWDVVNEPLADDGGFRQDAVWTKLGDGYVEDALRTARTYDPDARLVLNEIGAEGEGPKADALFGLVRRLLAAGAPLDGVGLQFHLTEDGGLPVGYKQNLRRLAGLGVDVEITELDVEIKKPVDDAKRRRQARVYAELGRTCAAIPRCRGLTVWGFTDRHSWIPATQPLYDEATLLDRELGAKPAFEALRDALAGQGSG